MLLTPAFIFPVRISLMASEAFRPAARDMCPLRCKSGSMSSLGASRHGCTPCTLSHVSQAGSPQPGLPLLHCQEVRLGLRFPCAGASSPLLLPWLLHGSSVHLHLNYSDAMTSKGSSNLPSRPTPCIPLPKHTHTAAGVIFLKRRLSPHSLAHDR